MKKRLLKQKLLETVHHWITENYERQNATELLQEAEIDTTVIREELSNTMLPIQSNDSSNTQSAPQKNPAQRNPQMKR